MATYYISYTDGDDARTPAEAQNSATPWKTITKVNSYQSSLVAGDTVSFKCGDTWSGVTLLIAKSGSSGNPITYNSYGTGNQPVITGFQTLSSWTDNGDGKYYATVVDAVSQTNIVTIDGVNTAMGRYPNAGTNLTYDNFSGTTSITDTGIGDSPDWVGADIVINKHYFILERDLITDHTGDVFTFTAYNGSPYMIVNNRYYFIQNDIRCVTETNEWYHDYAAGRLYIYGNPATKTVKIATIKYIVDTQTNYDYITLDNLNLSGSIRAIVNIGNEASKYGNNNNIIIQNCTIEFGGLEGIAARMNNVAAADCIITNNIIRHCNADGIYAYGNGFTITNNDISYIGIIPGVAYRGTDISGIRAAATTVESVYTIEYNIIQYTGYNGIGLYFSTIHADVNHNFINYAMQTTDDGGGIYNGGESSYERIIDYNIILNTGINNSNAVISRGIYLDSGADNAIVRYNTVAGSNGSGIIFHSGDDNTATYNTCYDNGYSSVSCGALDLLKYDTPNTGMVVNNNKFIAKTSTQRTLHSSHSVEELKNHGTFDYNYYARPISDSNSLYYLGEYHSLTDWQILTLQDLNSEQSPISISSEDDFHFIYNEHSYNIVYSLSSSMIDIEGISYEGIITLAPFTSLVLLGSGSITEVIVGVASRILKYSVL